jgi:hypothetical protein
MRESPYSEAVCPVMVCRQADIAQHGHTMYLRALNEELGLVDLQYGQTFFNHHLQREIKIYAFLCNLIGDLAAVRETTGLKGGNCKHPCFVCNIQRHEIRDFIVRNKEAGLRTHEEFVGLVANLPQSEQQYKETKKQAEVLDRTKQCSVNYKSYMFNIPFCQIPE